jgi:D-alanyl-lipoteichoic acid acyltransferase DltB (MBOAT superfamily)
MLFNSLQFLVFFPVVCALYFATPNRFRWFLLLVASYYFYMSWRPEYVLLLMTSTLVDYLAGLRMGACETRQRRRKYLWLSLVVNLGMLFAFKYEGMASQTLRDVLGIAGYRVDIPVFDFLLPIGISFYTFQTLSYTIDVYRGQRAPERHLGRSHSCRSSVRSTRSIGSAFRVGSG